MSQTGVKVAIQHKYTKTRETLSPSAYFPVRCPFLFLFLAPSQHNFHLIVSTRCHCHRKCLMPLKQAVHQWKKLVNKDSRRESYCYFYAKSSILQLKQMHLLGQHWHVSSYQPCEPHPHDIQGSCPENEKRSKKIWNKPRGCCTLRNMAGATVAQHPLHWRNKSNKQPRVLTGLDPMIDPTCRAAFPHLPKQYSSTLIGEKVQA